MKDTIFICTKEIIPPKQTKGIGGKCPCVDQKKEKVLKICSTYAIIHPRTVMIHPADTPIAYPAMMTHWWLEGLTLPTH